MGGPAALLPHHRTITSSHMNNPRRIPNPNPNPNFTRSNRRKRSPEKKKNNNGYKNRHTAAAAAAAAAVEDDFPAKNLVMGQVKLLKRGEKLTGMRSPVDEKKAGILDGLVSSPPPPEMGPKHKRIGDFYAGSAFFTSPPPSSLPLPAFFTRKSAVSVIPGTNLDAATDLRRLLRIEVM